MPTIFINDRNIALKHSHYYTRELKKFAKIGKSATVHRRAADGSVEDLQDEEIVQIADGDVLFSSETDEHAGKEKFFDLKFSTLLSVLAVMVSCYAVSLNIKHTKEINARDSLRNVFAMYFDYTKVQLQYPEILHLFALPSHYSGVCEKVRQHLQQMIAASARSRAEQPSGGPQGAQPTPPVAQALRERAIADYIFTFYEWVAREHRLAGEANDSARSEYSRKTLDYLHEVFQNPRLQYFWHDEELWRGFDRDTLESLRKAGLDRRRPYVDPAGPSLSISCPPMRSLGG